MRSSINRLNFVKEKKEPRHSLENKSSINQIKTSIESLTNRLN